MTDRGRLDDDVQQKTFESFGYEWTRFSKIEPEDELFWKKYFLDTSLADVRDLDALDAGCGKGRFAYFTAPHVRHLVGLDGSDAIDAARANLAGFRNVSLVRGDVRHLPFPDGSFGFVYCLGVIHHLAHPREGFNELVRVMAPSGTLLLYVYSRPTSFGSRAVGLRLAGWLRRFTTRIPHPILRLFSIPIAATLYSLVVIPGTVGARLGVRSLASLPLQTYRHRPLRSLWLDTFDRLSAPVEHRYTWPDIAPWFDSLGLVVEAVREDAGLFIVARKLRRDERGGGRAAARN